ncbi:MAG: hypothetical protein FWC50_13170 [Planctomycetaceae bacterium]|nr:hypothetical protein [Planctomycetaceae bacterium]
MSQKPLLLVCTSCHANIEVRNLNLVGQIVPCPKCGSMLLVELPAEHPESPHGHPEIDSLFHDDLPASHSPVSEPEAVIEKIIEENVSKQEGEISTAKNNPGFVGKIFLSWCAKWKQPLLSILKKLNPQNRITVWSLLGIAPLLLVTALIVSGLFRPAKNIETASQISSQTKESASDVSTPPNVDASDRSVAVSPEHHPEQNPEQNKDVSTNSPADDTTVVTESGVTIPGETTPSESLPAKIEDADNKNDADSVAKTAVDDKKPETGEKSSETGSSGPVRMGGLPEVQKTAPDQTKSDSSKSLADRVEMESSPAAESSVADETKSSDTGDKNMDDKNAGESVADQANEKETGVNERNDEEGNDIAKMRHEPVPALTRKKIDIDARLSLPVMTFQVEKKAIINVLRTLSDLTGVPMQLDVDELRARRISVEAPVTLQLKETNVAGIIAALLEKTHLTTRRYDGGMIFGYTEEQMSATSTVRYDLSRLAKLEKNPISAQQAADWMTQLLFDQKSNPKTQNGGIAVDGNEIVVVGNAWLQDQAERLYLSFHYLREIEPETKLTPEQIAPEVFGWDRVHEPLTLNLIEPKPLKDAARLVENGAKIRVLIDHAALWNEGLSQASMVSVHVNQGTVDRVLQEMLQPLGLTYRIVEANAVEITTPRVAAEKMTIEIQKYAPLEPGKTPELCVDTIKQVFGRERWNNKPNGTDSGGTVVTDAASGYLLVRQSQPLQREIRQWLGQLHATLEDGNSGNTPVNEEKTPENRENESVPSQETQKADSAEIQLQIPEIPAKP